jgi:cytochrome c553
MEFNATGATTNASLMACGQCHQYIINELNATDNSDYVAGMHINALTTEDYANASTDPNAFLHIGSFSGQTITTSTVCALCHAVETKISGSHTQVVTRACTDRDCHGYNSTFFGGTIVFGGQNITEKLTLDTDAHSTWFNAMEGTDSEYPKANATEGGYYKLGFYACLACHTHTGMSMNLTRPQVFNINVTRNESGVFISVPAMNYTVLNETVSYKPAHTSMWT